MEAHAVVVMGEPEVVHVAGKDAQVYKEEHQCSHGEHHAPREEEHGDAVPPPHPCSSADSSQSLSKPTSLLPECTVWNSSGNLEPGGHSGAKIPEHRLEF